MLTLGERRRNSFGSIPVSLCLLTSSLLLVDGRQATKETGMIGGGVKF